MIPADAGRLKKIKVSKQFETKLFIIFLFIIFETAVNLAFLSRKKFLNSFINQ